MIVSRAARDPDTTLHQKSEISDSLLVPASLNGDGGGLPGESTIWTLGGSDMVA